MSKGAQDLAAVNPRDKGGILVRPRTLDEPADRLDECEDMMLRELNSSRVQRVLSERWGVSRRQVRKYQEGVRKRWEIEAGVTGDRVARRDEMRELLRQGVAMAIRQQRVVFSSRGDAEYVDDPNLTAMAKMLHLLCQLDGLLDDNGSPDLSWLKKAVEGAPRTEEEAVELQEDLRNTEGG